MASGVRPNYSFTNIGSGVGTFKDINGSTVELKTITSPDGSITIVDDTINGIIKITAPTTAAGNVDGGTF